MRGTTKAVLGLAALVLLGSALLDEAPQRAARTAGGLPANRLEPTAPTADAPSSAAPSGTVQDSDLLQADNDGDGDSWHDTTGREYRLGLVNTPESSECFGSDATAKRKELTAGGFRAESYSTDNYGRSVAVVTLADGINLNVWLARQGYANDKYLEQFRHENPALAAELDAAFTAAKGERLGLWGACASSTPQGIGQLAPAPPPAQAPPAPAPADRGGCHSDYLTCIPIQGNGSGAGSANDLDCGQIGFAVRLAVVGIDPYRLDREGDGVGCEG